VDTGEPYAAELATVETLAAGKTELAEPLVALRSHAMEGVATLDELRAELSRLAPAILLAARDASDGGVLDGLADDLSLLLGGRPVGDVEGDSVDARVARAELRLEEGDLAAARAELQALEGAPAGAAQPWIARAEARQAALAATAEVQQLAQRWRVGN
jgi:uroporphyrinogen-III synthase